MNGEVSLVSNLSHVYGGHTGFDQMERYKTLAGRRNQGPRKALIGAINRNAIKNGPDAGTPRVERTIVMPRGTNDTARPLVEANFAQHFSIGEAYQSDNLLVDGTWINAYAVCWKAVYNGMVYFLSLINI